MLHQNKQIQSARFHISKIAQRSGEHSLVDEVENALCNKRAFLFTRGNDGWVLRPVSENGTVGVVVWAAWGDCGALMRHISEVKRLARMIDATWLRFQSVRRGWLKVAPEYGWCRKTDDADGFMVFEMELGGKHG